MLECLFPVLLFIVSSDNCFGLNGGSVKTELLNAQGYS